MRKNRETGEQPQGSAHDTFRADTSRAAVVSAFRIRPLCFFVSVPAGGLASLMTCASKCCFVEVAYESSIPPLLTTLP